MKNIWFVCSVSAEEVSESGSSSSVEEHSEDRPVRYF